MANWKKDHLHAHILIHGKWYNSWRKVLAWTISITTKLKIRWKLYQRTGKYEKYRNVTRHACNALLFYLDIKPNDKNRRLYRRGKFQIVLEIIAAPGFTHISSFRWVSPTFHDPLNFEVPNSMEHWTLNGKSYYLEVPKLVGY